MTSMRPRIISTSRILPQSIVEQESAIPLSLLDATTAKFGLTSAIWLLERPTVSLDLIELDNHLRTTLSTALKAYSQFSGHLKAILTINGDNLPPETTAFPAHARRYGRVYTHYGTSTDPGVEYIAATSSATVDDLYNARSSKRRPVWNRGEDVEGLTHFVPPTSIVQPLEPRERNAIGVEKPAMAVQCSRLACGGVVLAVKIAHPLADITTLTRFVRDWASVSHAVLTGTSLPVLKPIFEPSKLDSCAAGDINVHVADPTIMDDAFSLPLHRYDWWAPPAAPPSPFPTELPLAGEPLPWAEWDTNAPVDHYTLHFTGKQVEHLWQAAKRDDPNTSSNLKISKHDALLAHVWSSVVRARGLQHDQGPVHCDLVLGTRPSFQLDDSFIGSPTMMLNVEMPALEVANGTALDQIAQSIRKTLLTVNDPQRLAAHLHSIAYEKSPQRIWQAFLGKRHILVTTWARAGLYDVEFGLGSHIRYADGVVPCLDGCILIADGPPASPTMVSGGWTTSGVDITLSLRCEDMARLLKDTLLLPQVEPHKSDLDSTRNVN